MDYKNQNQICAGYQPSDYKYKWHIERCPNTAVGEEDLPVTASVWLTVDGHEEGNILVDDERALTALKCAIEEYEKRFFS